MEERQVLDDLVREVLALHEEDKNPRWLLALLRGFRSCLDVPQGTRAEDAERRSDAEIAFLEAVAAGDSSEGAAHRIVKDYRKRMRRLRAAARRRLAREVLVTPEVITGLAGGVDDLTLGYAAEVEARRARWAALLVAGKVDARGLRLVWQTRAQGRAVKEVAAELGMSYASALKHRRRIENTLKEGEQN